MWNVYVFPTPYMGRSYMNNIEGFAAKRELVQKTCVVHVFLKVERLENSLI